ncbi:clathrin adaptor, mu subunit [Basidiobolus meristosporus CBS 931.73]|uniref:Coatomer subunit delta n=1 Tax=Basidiobolus meristosporus CBS 931.73 TaxID=1314790 RepID=A0A1Y1YM44_9FUNG|nr:clathrin adaptor, mu subunit [Basidiobolus meristosporus CBS 931.73]|eukprot:ORX98913.1 clathrin adaptor, mu subunit [Basidiobolus meristosporus CBS 931.73]
MVVLAASICTKAGKVVISRQFLEMPRSRIEGLLASFPKLTGTGQQHTTIETDNIRYVYQPLEDLYMVIITNRQSNILQDIDTLHLFARVVSDTCHPTDESEILYHSFELLSAFDEIVSLGYRENVNLAQIRTIIEMESHEEKIQEMIAKNKEREAKEELKRKAKQLEMQRKEMAKSGRSFSGSGSFGSSGPMGGSYKPGMNEPTSYATQSEVESHSYSNPTPTPAPAPSGKGMKLGRSQKSQDFMEVLKSETGTSELENLTEKLSVSSPVEQISSPQIPTESVHIQIEERISVVADRDGGLQNMEVKGDLVLRVSDPDLAHLKLILNPLTKEGIQFKTHPNVDKKLFNSEHCVALKDPSRPFPLNTSLGVVKWRYSSKDEDSIPLAINCWPSPSGDGSCDVNIEYELLSDELELKDVVISIPIPGGTTPTVGDVDGHYNFDRSSRCLDWEIPIVDQDNKSGSLEFSVGSDDTNAFFPVNVSFVSEQTYSGIEVSKLELYGTGDEPIYSKEVLLIAEEYSVV